MATAAVEREMRTGLEAKADIWSLEELQHKRRKLLEEWSPLAAMYGGSRGQGSPSDAARKRHRDIIATKIAIEMEQEFRKNGGTGAFKKPAETELERLANAHPDHIARCEEMQKEVIRYFYLDNEIKEINERIESRKMELSAYTAELRLQ